jgi:putative oxidoreductase
MNAQPQMLLVGRILLAQMFLVAGSYKLMAVAGTTAYMTKLGFPMPEVVTWIAIIIELGGSLLLILGWQTRRIAWLLILFIVIATAMAHRFWEFQGPQYMGQLNYFLKNVSIIGGLLYVIVFGPGSLSIDARQGVGRPVTA